MAMSTLDDFLAKKRDFLHGVMSTPPEEAEPLTLTASVSVRGATGVRVIKVRHFEMLNDTALDLAGYDFGPNSPEHALVALGGCVAHTAEAVAALMELSIDTIEVEVAAEAHPLAKTPGFEDVPLEPHNLRYVLKIGSKEPKAQIEALHAQILAICPVVNLIRNPQNIAAELVFVKSEPHTA